MRGQVAAVAVLAALVSRPAMGQPTGSAPAVSTIGRTIAVLGFDALGMEADKVARLEALFRMELERLARASTPSPREIARAVRGTPLARCGGENTCLAAIGKKLAVQVVVTGNVAQLGDSHVINIKAVDAVTGKELRRIKSDPLRGTPDELIDAVRVAAYRLLAPERLLGSVTVLADIAGAEVRLDGRPIGKTPLPRAIERIPLGKHKLEVVAESYSPFADEVEVRFQKTTRVLVTLAAEAVRPRLDLARRGKPQPAPTRWYNSTWFLVGAGVAAVVVGASIGYALSRQEVVRLLDVSGGVPVRGLAIALVLVAASAPAAAQPKAAPGRPAAPRPGGPRHRMVIAPLATLGSESKAADVRAAQKLVSRGLASLGSVELVDGSTMLEAVKRAKRPELRSCDGELACLVALGQLVSADYTVFGEVGGLGSAQVIYLKLVDVKAAREVRSTVLELDGTRAADVEARAAATRLFAPARYVGELVLASNVVGASVYVDGELVARTPSRPVALPVGSHALRVTHPEFRDFVRFVEIGFSGREQVNVQLVPYDAVSGDIRRTGQDGAGDFGPGGVAPTPWYRRWYTVAGGAAVLILTSALVVGLVADGGIDFDREKEVP